MTLQEILGKCRNGDKIHRKMWNADYKCYLVYEDEFSPLKWMDGNIFSPLVSCFLRDDWEFYDEPEEKCEACELNKGAATDIAEVQAFLLKKACKCKNKKETPMTEELKPSKCDCGSETYIADKDVHGKFTCCTKRDI